MKLTFESWVVFLEDEYRVEHTVCDIYIVHNVIKYYFIKNFHFVCMCTSCSVKVFLTVGS